MRCPSDWRSFQDVQAALLFAAGTGSTSLVDVLVDQLGAFVNGFATPALCLDCDPVVRTADCALNHSIGNETPLMAALRSSNSTMAQYLISRGANVNLSNQVRDVAVMRSHVFAHEVAGAVCCAVWQVAVPLCLQCGQFGLRSTTRS